MELFRITMGPHLLGFGCAVWHGEARNVRRRRLTTRGGVGRGTAFSSAIPRRRCHSRKASAAEGHEFEGVVVSSTMPGDGFAAEAAAVPCQVDLGLPQPGKAVHDRARGRRSRVDLQRARVRTVPKPPHK